MFGKQQYVTCFQLQVSEYRPRYRRELLLVADLPGVSRDGLKVHLEKDELLIEGTATKERDGEALNREFPHLSFRRAFSLPGGIDRERVEAEFKLGVLRLHLPKAEAIKPRRIQVRAG